MSKGFLDQISDLVFKEAERQAKGWLRNPFLTTAGVGKIGLLLEDIELEIDVPFEKLFEHQLTDENWSGNDLILWADYLESFAHRLRKIAKERP